MSKDCFRGIFANVFHALSDQMNFTFTVMLKDGNADIAAADFIITNERSAVVDFLPSLMEVGTNIKECLRVAGGAWMAWAPVPTPRRVLHARVNSAGGDLSVH